VVLADQEADHNALRKIRATYEDALNNKRSDKVKPLLADGFTGVMISGEEIKSFEDLQAFLEEGLESHRCGRAAIT